ncbi:MAG TPA: class I SAM-dependent methyltransferase [Chloroflexia bacterium]|nr:class I SAM-dependent methyltransferase [Chloroflexia bacterium]
MDAHTARTRADFDRLAALDTGAWSHNSHYHAYLLRHLPRRIDSALEIGCGTGEFSRLLARRARRVTALDLSPEMVRVARERSANYPGIDYIAADATTWDISPNTYDCAASIATLHHLPLEPTLTRMRDALRPGGTLLVLDLHAPDFPGDYLRSALALPVSLALRMLHRLPLREPPNVRAAWAEHARHDVYPHVDEVERLCARLLPGARVRKHLLWRYSLTWRKPD